jgi:hypothetical protein
MTLASPVHLHFEDSGEWHSLPEWAEYFISVGKLLASEPHSGSRLVSAIVVPTRAFAAAFVALGMVINEAAGRDRASEAAHFQDLFDLPPGTTVIYRPKPGKILRGVLQSPVEYAGQLRIRVQVHSKEGGALTHVLGEERALQVQLAGHSGKLPKSQGSANSRFVNGFVEGLLGDADPVQLGVRSKVVCALVGRKNALEQEIRKTPLAIHLNGHPQAEGMLQDVLRVDRFITGQQAYRSALVPVAGEPPSIGVGRAVETGVVFDGATGFLKWGDRWRDRHQVIILDRTEPYFDDAVSAINNRFSQRRTDDGSTLTDAEAPPGGEVLAFREAAT